MLTIGITTFEHRFETYFKPLLRQIMQFESNIEVIVAINGEHKQDFNNTYREEILDFIGGAPNTYPIMFPTFRGLSKLWNSIIIHSSNDHILLLNDDVTITHDYFLKGVRECISQSLNYSFKINYSWSHAVVYKPQVIELGFFDERLLGIGEEDGDFEWRYNKMYGSQIALAQIPGIVNHVDMSHAPTNIVAGTSGKYSKFNRDTLFRTIYHEDNNAGKAFGMISEKLIENHREKQYPYEEFYRENKNKI